MCHGATCRPLLTSTIPRESKRCVMAAAFAIFGGLLLWRKKFLWPYFLAFAAVFLLAALLAPKSLRLVERGWMKFGEKMSVVMTAIILTVAFFVVMAPMGLLMRL